MTGQNHEIRVRVTKEELDAIERKAKRLHLKASVFMKLAGLNADFSFNSSTNAE
jgi:hypothetical protein